MSVKNKAIADPSFTTSSEENNNNNNNNKEATTVIPTQKHSQGVLQMRSSQTGRGGKKRGQKVPKSETSNLEQQLVEMSDEKANQRVRGGIQSWEFATVQMIMKMEGQCRVTFQFPSDFDREVGQTFKVFGRLLSTPRRVFPELMLILARVNRTTTKKVRTVSLKRRR